MSENQIVVYQLNETVRLDVRLESDTVWLTQAQLCDLFKRDVSKWLIFFVVAITSPLILPVRLC